MREAIRRLVREPLVHFLLIGALLFAGISVAKDLRRPSVRIDAAEINQLAAYWELQMQRPPTKAELAGIIQGCVDEEILAREAIRLGLDKDDMIVRRRLAQKMAFAGEDLAAVLAEGALALARGARGAGHRVGLQGRDGRLIQLHVQAHARALPQGLGQREGRRRHRIAHVVVEEVQRVLDLIRRGVRAQEQQGRGDAGPDAGNYLAHPHPPLTPLPPPMDPSRVEKSFCSRVCLPPEPGSMMGSASFSRS